MTRPHPIMHPQRRPGGRKRAFPPLALLTDFGQRDSFVGQMKGVILGIAAGATVVDLSHEVPPQDILAGALLLDSALEAFPRGTVYVCVVDPGVGSDRLAIAAQTSRGFFVAPDNGLLTPVMEEPGPVVVRRIQHPLLHRASVTSTFHGRDLFAVAGARLAAGFPFKRVGPVVEAPVRLSLPRAEVTSEGLEGVVVSLDRFGNAGTSIRAADLKSLEGSVTVTWRGRDFGPIRRYYSQAPPAWPIALIDSAGRLELAVNGGSAADLGIRVGDRVLVMANR